MPSLTLGGGINRGISGLTVAQSITFSDVKEEWLGW